MQSFVPAGARQRIGENYWMPIRGDFMEADFIELNRPQRDMDADAAVEGARINQNWADILYQGASRKRAY